MPARAQRCSQLLHLPVAPPSSGERPLRRLAPADTVQCALRHRPDVRWRDLALEGLQTNQRFSEDVDITYDIRAIAGDLIETTGVIPATRSQQEKLTEAVRDRLPRWLRDDVIPYVESAITQDGTNAVVTLNNDTVEVHYPPLVEGPGYVRPVELLEFGARRTSRGPHDQVRCRRASTRAARAPRFRRARFLDTPSSYDASPFLEDVRLDGLSHRHRIAELAGFALRDAFTR